MWQDVWYGFRLLIASPSFTAVAVLTLGLGIAVNTTVFSWIDGLLLHPFGGASDSARLAVLEMITAGAPNGANQTSYVDYRDYRRNLNSLSGLAVHREDVFSLGDTGTAQPVWGELVSGNYFDVLGVKAAVGRVFLPEEDADTLGAFPITVISHGLWRRRFHKDPAVVGKTLRVNRRDLTVIGVAPPEFRGTMPGLSFDIWVPVTMASELSMLGKSAFRNRGYRCLYAIARLKPGFEIEKARAEAAIFSHNLEIVFPDTNRNVTATILPVWEFHSAAPDLLLKPLRILMAVSILVLLIVCANVANLLLARAVARRKELSIRQALGAGRGRLVRQLLTEALTLATGAAVAGLVMASWMANSLPGLIPKINAPVTIGLQLSGSVIAFTILVCVLAALISGTAPALFWLRSDVNRTLKEGGRSGNTGTQSHRMHGLLVISEVALATVALLGAGLFVKSFQNARALDPGFDRTRVLLARFFMSGSGFSRLEMQQFYLRLRERLGQAHGIANVSYADYAPLGTGAGPFTKIDVEGYLPAEGESMSINRSLVAPRYFDLLRIPVIGGRDSTDSDDWNAAPVIIVNQSFARAYFQGENPVSRKVRFRSKWHTIVGLVKDNKHFNIAESPRPHFFAPFLQHGTADNQVFVFIKTTRDPISTMGEVRHQIARVNPKTVAFDLMPLVEWTEVTLLPQKVAASLMAALGLTSLIVAAVGLYSVVAYAVTRRTQEIGIRMALGAKSRDVLASVLWRGLALAIPGVIAGAAVAFGLTRLISNMLVNMSATDSTTFVGVALFLISVALLASYLPAQRATNVDPVVALRRE